MREPTTNGDTIHVRLELEDGSPAYSASDNFALYTYRWRWPWLGRVLPRVVLERLAKFIDRNGGPLLRQMRRRTTRGWPPAGARCSTTMMSSRELELRLEELATAAGIDVSTAEGLRGARGPRAHVPRAHPRGCEPPGR